MTDGGYVSVKLQPELAPVIRFVPLTILWA